MFFSRHAKTDEENIMIAYKPTKDLFRYTVFKSHVERMVISQREQKLDTVILDPNRGRLVPDDNRGEPKKRLVEILDESQVYLISGCSNQDKTACLILGARECIDKSFVPCQVNREYLGSTWKIDQIYATVKALVHEKLTEVAESPNFKRGQQKAADRGLDKIRDCESAPTCNCVKQKT